MASKIYSVEDFRHEYLDRFGMETRCTDEQIRAIAQRNIIARADVEWRHGEKQVRDPVPFILDDMWDADRSNPQAKLAPRRLTNVEFVADLMEHSRYGALAQLFVIDALWKWSEIISKADPKSCGNAIMDGKGWVAVAKEIREKLEARKS